MGRKLKRRYMYIYSWFTSQYSRNEHNIVKHLYCCRHCSVAKLEQSVQLFATPRTAAWQSFTVSQSLVKLMSVESVMPSNHLILCRAPLLLPSVFPSIMVFSSESALHIRWPKYWSFSFNINVPMNTQDWFPLGWTGWISLQSKGLSRVFSNTTVQKHQFFSTQFS